ncbi:MAG: VacJ family lipoprotein [Acetobacteraceae bacterium]
MRAACTFRCLSPGRLRHALLAGLVMVVLAACATPPPADDPDAVADYKETNDPLEPTNRVFYAINNGIDTVLLKPAAEAYRYVVPGKVRTGVDNMLSNLATPVRLGNDILEGKPRRAGDTTMRFFINTTAGVLGFFDVASDLGYRSHDANFGLTLANWGIDEGPFLFLPILGPSNPRDATGFAVDTVADPFKWVGQGTAVQALSWSRFGLNALNQREKVLDPIDQIKKTALDPYATFRSLYRQYRASQLRNLREDNRATIPVWFPQRAGQEINPPPR